MKNLILLLTACVFVGCSSLNSMKEQRKETKLVVLPFGYHELLMAQKDSAFVNDCLMSDPGYYMKHIDKKGYDGDMPPTFRNVLEMPNLSKANPPKSSLTKSSFLLCLDSTGTPKFSKFLNTNSKDEEFIRRLHHLSLDLRFEEVTLSNCLECAELTLNTFGSTVTKFD